MNLSDKLIVAIILLLFFCMVLLVRYIVIWRSDMQNTKIRLMHMESVVQNNVKSQSVKQEAKEIIHPKLLIFDKNASDSVEAIRHYIQAYHPEFMNFISHYSENKLTPSDELLCMMIKLEYSSKEMAAVLSITTNSVIKARYRLKKKLMLYSDQSLDEWIQSVHTETKPEQRYTT